MKKPASKVAKPAKIQPKSQFLFHKKLPSRDFSIMTLPESSIDNCMAELFPEAILIFELVLAKTLSSFFFNSKNFVKRVLQFATSLMMAILNIKMSLCA